MKTTHQRWSATLLTFGLTLTFALHPASVKAQNYVQCYCLRYAKQQTGKYPAASSARDIKRKYPGRVSKTPRVNSIVLMTSSWWPQYGHSGKVVKVDKASIWVRHKGWLPNSCAATTTKFSRADRRITGYYN